MPDPGQTSSPQDTDDIATALLANPGLHIDLMGEYVTETRRMDEWQDRARRVINTANKIVDSRVAIVELRRVLVNTDFRDE